MPRRLIGTLIAAAALATGAAACGDDDGTDTVDTAIPTISVPEQTTGATTGSTGTTTQGSGGAQDTSGGGGGGGGYNPAKPDSPTNDKPPPPGSPAERFEKACEKNPDLCG